MYMSLFLKGFLIFLLFTFSKRAVPQQGEMSVWVLQGLSVPLCPLQGMAPHFVSALRAAGSGLWRKKHPWYLQPAAFPSGVSSGVAAQPSAVQGEACRGFTLSRSPTALGVCSEKWSGAGDAAQV